VPQLPPQLADSLRDRYRIERELGRGGMATVYLAHDLRHDRLVALKVLHAELARALGPERFLQEIRLAARLQHPHLLSVHDSGDADGTLWFTMPYVEGRSLRDRLRREGQLPLDDAVRIAHEAARALDYAHRHHVIHRDIKPENILLTEDGDTLVADFGVGRALGAGDQDQRLTETGIVVGTPAYMSPEQSTGERELDGRSDIYSLGSVLYEMLAGEPPFTGPTVQAIVARRLSESPRPLAATRETIPPAVEAIASRALARAPADRFATAGAMADALEAARHAGPAATTTRVPAGRPSRAPGRSRKATAVAVILGGMAAAAVGLLRSRLVPPSSLDTTLVAIAPFEVLAPSLALWREGLVDLLSRNLDGAGPLRAVPPTTVIRRWEGRADPESAAELGRRTGAGLALYGSLLSAGPDSVRLRATLYDVAAQRAVEELEAIDASDRVDRAADSLTFRVLRAIGRTRAIGAARQSPFSSTSLPALKAFLQGEQYFRHTNWDSASTYYQRAIALDSGFALALRRESYVLGWVRSGYDSVSNDYALAAGARNRGLAPRDSLLVLGDSLMASLFRAGPFATRADSAWGARLRRAFATAETLTDRYPDDPEAWFQLGELTEHFGPFAGRRAGEVVASFGRAIALDSAFAPAYIHPVEDAALAGVQELHAYLRPYLALNPREREADGGRLVQLLLDSATTAADVPRLAAPVSLDALFESSNVLSLLPDSAELGVALMQVTRRRPPSGSTPFRRQLVMDISMARQLMSRGHLAKAAPFIVDNDTTWLYADAALIGAIPPDSAAAVFRRRLAGPIEQRLIEAFPWWAGRRDTASLKVAAARADSAGRLGANPDARSRARYAAISAAAYLALARRDTAAALARLGELQPDGCPGCYLDRLTQAQLLAAQGHDQDAWAIVSADHLSFTLSPFPTAVLWVLLRARVAERLGDRATALRSYGWVAGMWRKPDAVLEPYAAEARAGLERLAGEPR
jgi:serine/threonine-protein kinase